LVPAIAKSAVRLPGHFHEQIGNIAIQDPGYSYQRRNPDVGFAKFELVPGLGQAPPDFCGGTTLTQAKRLPMLPDLRRTQKCSCHPLDSISNLPTFCILAKSGSKRDETKKVFSRAGEPRTLMTCASASPPALFMVNSSGSLSPAPHVLDEAHAALGVLLGSGREVQEVLSAVRVDAPPSSFFSNLARSDGAIHEARYQCPVSWANHTDTAESDAETKKGR
jgi:hypothetical protein